MLGIRTVTVLGLIWFAGSVHAVALPDLTARVGNFTSYGWTSRDLKNNRYEMHLEATSAFSSRLSLVAEGRARADLVYSELRFMSGSKYSETVRNDQLFEAEMRQFYLDYLADSFRWKLGWQKIDWMEMITPYISDALTPFDYRYGGFGPTSENIVPVGAFSINHRFLGGTLEWLAIVFPKPNRMPVADNGFGFYSYLQEQFNVFGPTISEQRIPIQLDQIEFGARYAATWRGLDLSLLAFRGHQRSPALALSSGTSGNALVLKYPTNVVLGMFASYATGSLVLRLSTIFEPRRFPSLWVDAPLTPATGDKAYERREQVAVGVDYAFSKHLKAYTSAIYNRRDSFRNPAHDLTGMPKDSYMFISRFTNESFSNLQMSVNAIFAGPRKSFLLSPEVEYRVSPGMTVAGGVHWIRSYSPSSVFESLKNQSQAFVQLTYRWTAR